MTSTTQLALVTSVISVLVLLAVFFILPLFDPWYTEVTSVGRLTDPDLVEVPARSVIEAISAFEKVHGHPPDQLMELEPNFLSPIPTPAWGTKEWEYDRHGQEYELGVFKRKDYYESYSYSSKSKGWFYDS